MKLTPINILQFNTDNPIGELAINTIEIVSNYYKVKFPFKKGKEGIQIHKNMLIVLLRDINKLYFREISELCFRSYSTIYTSYYKHITLQQSKEYKVLTELIHQRNSQYGEITGLLGSTKN